MQQHKLVLMILDGWGIGKGDNSDAIAQAKTPFMDRALATRPNARLRTDGEHVGLPHGQMGNSEVGHLNIGAGRVVHQELVRIGKAIDDGSLEKNVTLRTAFETARTGTGRLHLVGLVSDGGVHSSQAHLHALLGMAKRASVPEVYVHAFTDGRDTDPQSGRSFIEQLEQQANSTGARIASVIGRYYAMDRDQRWERIRKAYELLVHGKGESFNSATEGVIASYAAGITDEFIAPIVVSDGQGPTATIRPNDVVICFNFRTDRCREITQALTQQAFPEQGMKPLPLHYVTMTEYDPTYKGVHVLFRKDDLPMTMGEAISRAGRSQIRIAETEKYPHVTFFFSGGREAPFEGERRIMVPSPKVATYDLQPEMSAPEVTAKIVAELKQGVVDFVCLNFANPDMVGHTGVFEAIVKAVETTDRCAGEVVAAGLQANYSVIIIADHGNADLAVNPDGSPNTAHSTNPVNIVLFDEREFQLKDGILADVAPTILELMDMKKPAEMTGSSLLVH